MVYPGAPWSHAPRNLGSPPFGPACFFLKSVAPPQIQLQTIFRAVLPFIGLQAVGLFLGLFIQDIALWPPAACGAGRQAQPTT